MNEPRFLRVVILLAVGVLAAASPARSEEPGPGEPAVAPAVAPGLVHYQGRFVDNAGDPLPGPVQLTFRLYDAAGGGAALWTETHASVELTDGVAAVLLGSVASLPANAFSGGTRYLGLTVDGGEELAPRLRVASVPFALEADHLDGLSSEDFEPRGAVAALSVNDNTPPNQGSNRLHWNNLYGVPEEIADGEDAGVADHSELGGLGDDDHPQYAQEEDLAGSGGAGPNDGKNLVHWENLTGVPSGFADGADNTGPGGTNDHGSLEGLADDDHPQYATDGDVTAVAEDLAAHEGAVDPHSRYATDGDVTLLEQDLTAHAEAPAAHHGKTVDASELVTGDLDPARIPFGGIEGYHLQNSTITQLDLGDGSVTGAKVADGSLTGDDVGDGTLSVAKLADESGVGYLADTDLHTLTGNPATLVTAQIDCPAAGWVLASVTAQTCLISTIAGGEHSLELSVSTEPDTHDDGSRVQMRVFGLLATRQCAPLHTQRLYPVEAGVNTFQVVAHESNSAAGEVTAINVSLVFFGTRY